MIAGIRCEHKLNIIRCDLYYIQTDLNVDRNCHYLPVNKIGFSENEIIGQDLSN